MLVLRTLRMRGVRIKLLNLWRFFNFKGVFHCIGLNLVLFINLRDISLLLSNIRHHHSLVLLLLSRLYLLPLLFALITGHVFFIMLNRRT